MSNQNTYDQADADGPSLEAYDELSAEAMGRARPIPRISIQAFCEHPDTAQAMQVAAEDRRLAKAHVSVHMGGVSAAVAHYQESPTPNLIMIESSMPRQNVLAELDRLAECCDAGTKVIVVGHINDVLLYRELLKRGVSEYLVAPVVPLQLMESISNLYNDPDSDPVGNVIAFIGAKGGVGSSTICHNVGWALSEALQNDVVIADLDLAFGTTSLDFNQDPIQGIAEALSSPERLDEVLLDRLLTKCTDRLSIFAAPVLLDRDYDISADACDMVIDVVRQNVPFVFVDVPHTWTSWSKRILMGADEVVITATPDLANLRNAKNIVDLLKQTRANDGPPRLILNMTGQPKRQEIPIKEFCQHLELQASAIVEFDPETFSNASANGRMIEEVNKKAKAAATMRSIGLSLANRQDMAPSQKSSAGSALAPLLAKLKLKK